MMACIFNSKVNCPVCDPRHAKKRKSKKTKRNMGFACEHCGKHIQKTITTIKVIDSCEANKAKAAIKEILLQVGDASDCVIDVDPDRLLRLLKKYGFERAK